MRSAHLSASRRPGSRPSRTLPSCVVYAEQPPGKRCRSMGKQSDSLGISPIWRHNQSQLIAGLPEPAEDESFSSWLNRCAIAYGHDTEWQFLKSICGTRWRNGMPLITDFDVNPPDRLIELLVTRTRFSRRALEDMLALDPRTTLTPEWRTSYCPQCFAIDVEKGPIYRRRIWDNAWTVSCVRHGCWLGERLKPEEYYSHTPFNLPDPILSPANQEKYGVLSKGWIVAPQIRRPRNQRASAQSVWLDDTFNNYWDTCRWGRNLPVTLSPRFNDHWVHWRHPPLRAELDTTMLMHPLGRSLVLFLGSFVAWPVTSDVYGDMRVQSHWYEHRLGGYRCDWPGTDVPNAGISARAQAAMTASIFWPTLNHEWDIPQIPEQWMRILRIIGIKQ